MVDEKVEKALNKLNDEYFSQLLPRHVKMYVDFEALQDLMFGSLLSFITVKEELDYIQHFMTKYGLRSRPGTAHYFPLMEKSDGELRKRYLDHSELICTIAPFTAMYQSLILNLNRVKTQHCMDRKDRSLSVMINCNDVNYPQDLRNQFDATIRSYVPYAQMIWTNAPRYVQSNYGEFNVLFLSDPAIFLAEETNSSNQFFKEGKLANSTLYIPAILGPDKVDVPEDQIDTAFAETKRWLELFCEEVHLVKQVLREINV